MPEPSNSFARLKLPSSLTGNLASLGFREMTPVQEQALPVIVQGKDVIVRAKTGSGKTVAFGLGLLAGLDVRVYRVQALIVCPTRELADQVAAELRRLARQIPNLKVLTLCGGNPLGPQIGSLVHGAHIVVGTPGRLLKHLRKNTLQTDAVRTLVLDEADRMLDMGFEEDLAEIIKKIPQDRQTLLFSATYPDSIEAMSAGIQRSPISIDVTGDEAPNAVVEHFFEVAPARTRTSEDAWSENSKPDRLVALDAFLRHFRPATSLVFCNTKIDCHELAAALRQRGFCAMALHGDLEQREREDVLIRFANGSVSILIATDVAARGLDIKDLAAVFNFELPTQRQIYIHRIGRTARAGSTGLAVSFFNAKQAHRLPESAGNSVGLPLTPVEFSEALLRPPVAPTMVSLCINGGRKNKLRPGDILGALTAGGSIRADDVGKINVGDHQAYVAISKSKAAVALELLSGRMKGRIFKVRTLDPASSPAPARSRVNSSKRR